MDNHQALKKFIVTKYIEIFPDNEDKNKLPEYDS